MHMLFDIAIANHDDHLRNHGFLLRGDSWELSPAFDINPVPNEQFLEMYIDTESGYRSFDKAIETCVFYHISKDKAVRLVRTFSEIIAATWKDIASKNGIKESEQKIMSSAFGLAEEACKKYSKISVSTSIM